MAAAALVLGSAPATAQVGGVLSGLVRDGAGNPVPGVVLTVVGPTERDARVVITDQRGAYFIDRLHYGTEYELDVSHPRFRKSRVRASANEGEAPVEITLSPRRSRLARVGHFWLRVVRLPVDAFR